ncbi:MAG TPA: YMGG-like glycine zipper-containing protein [bacterium]|nr:YMGG-like glycine zipper-containing protein [bacterium]HOM27523.1 YMGG-like glycine zipper-containing protein [bacterium]
MKRIAGILLIGLLLFSGCETIGNLSEKTKQGATIGAVAGGILGAIIDSNKPWRGAIIGAATGAVAGGWIGNTLEKKSEEKVVEANKDVVTQAANEAGKLNAVVKYSRVTENGVKEEIVATPGQLKDNKRMVTVEYLRDGKLISKEVREVTIN